MIERLDTAGRPVRMTSMGEQSYPAFMDGFFCGIEFPVASSRQEGKTLILSHLPGLRLQPGEWHASRKAVYGVALPGEEKRQFNRYIASHHSKYRGFHINYNSWWTSSAPAYTERQLLGLMKTFEEKLTKPYGVGFDTFTIDLGWSNPQSIWEIEPHRFPQGFTNLQKAAADMNTRLGLWMSPSGCYPGAQEIEWARSHGYETFVYTPWRPGRFLCLAGERYRSQLEARMIEMATRYGVRQFKLDGSLLECTASDHGHEPGLLSAEAVAEGAIKTYAAVRKAAPDVWLETCSWGWNPSPWWLYHVDSVIGCYGGDIVFGRVPAPVYRESYTSSRDFHNLQGAVQGDVPITFQAPLGLVHQTDEDFMNDAVVVLMRGEMFLPLYFNPVQMNPLRWKNLASVIKWARRNAPRLEETDPLVPASWLKAGVPPLTFDAVMPREPYGYAHWKGNEALIGIRNPWVMPAVYELKLDRASGAPTGAAGLSAVSLYPEIRLYGQGLKSGDTLRVPLAPYETVLLSLKRRQSLAGVPAVADRIGGKVLVASKHCEVKRVDPRGAEAMQGQTTSGTTRNLYATDEFTPAEDAATTATQPMLWTSHLGKNRFATRIKLNADVFTTSDRAQFLVLLEGGKVPPKYACQLKINNQEFTLDARPSVANWYPYNIGTLNSIEPQWVFLKCDLQRIHGAEEKGYHSVITLDLLAGDNCTKVSAWIWATKPGGVTPDYPNALPSPEMLSLDGAALMEPVKLEAISSSMAKK